MLNRRDLFHGAAGAGAASVLPGSDAYAEPPQPWRIVDTNVSLFHWPFRRLPLDQPARLVAKLQSLGVTQAWAGSLEAVLHRDLGSANRRLLETCRKYSLLTPIGAVNPQLPGWEKDLRGCLDSEEVAGVRVYPNYHDYALTDPRFLQLIEAASDAGRFVQIAAAMEDVRTQHPRLRAEDVDLTELPAIASRFPDARIQVLNLRPRASLVSALAKAPNVYLDTSRVEGTDGVPALFEGMGGRVLFGTHAPLLIPEAALIRTHESNRLKEPALRRLLGDTARSWIASTAK